MREKETSAGIIEKVSAEGECSLEYQESWQWIKSNWHAPVPSVAYVAAVSVGVSAKNAFVTSKHDVFVERQPGPTEVVADTVVCLPRICIARRGSSMEAIIAHLIESRGR